MHAGCVQDMCIYVAGAARPYSSLAKLVYVQSIVFLNDLCVRHPILDQTHRFSYCEMVMEPSQNKNNEHWGIDETKFFISMWRQDEILRKIQDKGTRKKKV